MWICKMGIRKEQIVNRLREKLRNNIDEINQNILLARESRDNNTKSTVGDKYETSREMMNLKIEKYNIQLAKALRLQKELDKINLQKKFEQVEFGSLVFTRNNIYFISIGFGRIDIENESVYCVSLASPIGKTLNHKKTGDVVGFQGTEIIINNIQ